MYSRNTVRAGLIIIETWKKLVLWICWILKEREGSNMAQYLNNASVCVLYMKSPLIAINSWLLEQFQKIVRLPYQKPKPSSPMLSLEVHSCWCSSRQHRIWLTMNETNPPPLKEVMNLCLGLFLPISICGGVLFWLIVQQLELSIIGQWHGWH